LVKNSTAIIVVDIQADFTEYRHGSLPVPNTDAAYVQLVNAETTRLHQAGFHIYATQDWHPANHVSFSLWPPHCIANTPGAELLLDENLFTAITHKGTDPEYDSYSGFKDDHNRPTDLNKQLQKNHIKTIVIYGLATDYCVQATAIDGIKTGYEVIVLKDLCRGVNPATTEKALAAMEELGIKLMLDIPQPEILF
jgi:nicotinamidase/pyrazinamidase